MRYCSIMIRNIDEFKKVKVDLTKCRIKFSVYIIDKNYILKILKVFERNPKI